MAANVACGSGKTVPEALFIKHPPGLGFYLKDCSLNDQQILAAVSQEETFEEKKIGNVIVSGTAEAIMFRKVAAPAPAPAAAAPAPAKEEKKKGGKFGKAAGSLSKVKSAVPAKSSSSATPAAAPVQETIVQEMLPLFAINSVTLSKELILTIIYGRGKQFRLALKDNNKVQSWMYYLQKYVPLNYAKLDADKYRKYFEQHSNGSDSMDFTTASNMFVDMCYSGSNQEIVDNLTKADASGKLTSQSYNALIKRLIERKEITDLYNKLCGSSASINDSHIGHMSQDVFLGFLKQQGEANATAQWAQEIFNSFPSSGGKLSLDGFTEYLLSGETNNLFDPKKATDIYQDMTRPMCDYYIYSSHNSYLETDQLQGKSSLDQYERILLTGCRCIELDVWDGPDGVPIITHGGTKTSKILTSDVLNTIKQFGFLTTPYPLILSVENHLKEEQEGIFVSQLNDILGDMVLAPWDESLKVLPSPEETKYKVILKGGSCTPTFKKMVHLPSREFKGEVQADRRPNQMVSKSEGDLPNPKKEDSPFFQYTNKFLLRTYPAGHRVESSNYCPVVPWCLGAQLVALNFQTLDPEMHRNNMFFRDNGACGFKLKPAHLLANNFTPNPVSVKITIFSARMLQKPKLDLSVSSSMDAGAAMEKGKVAANKFLRQGSQAVASKGAPKGDGSVKINPFVTVKMHGMPGDTVTNKTGCASAQNDFGLLAGWGETFSYKVNFPDLALIEFSIFHKDIASELKLAHNIIPLSCARGGFRVVPLLGIDNRPVPLSNLFVKLEWE
eukprot:CAMPEP_0201542018 /NCGR_PEP_ID=MMETSP0161_2-20130828/71789_1 /ASSEMBLY_ACC=CAM_ASM_000251 /TAXON_ID=180227 /ORGANISM="Neoparamoeba aestuarina, Strain SoJaBio B1-5/56/2" /LENGTH=783 /DNA_ID=CAMNT_0047949607 /DNA_START=58 /DNA_END=2409 /DNA_ORIENTATION=-